MSSLTIKQRKLVAGVAAGLPKRTAAIQAGYSERSAHAVAHETLKNPEVIRSLNEIMHDNGITDSYIADKLIELAEATTNGNHPHWPARARALDMMLKVKGHYVPEMQETKFEIPIDQLTSRIAALAPSLLKYVGGSQILEAELDEEQVGRKIGECDSINFIEYKKARKANKTYEQLMEVFGK